MLRVTDVTAFRRNGRDALVFRMVEKMDVRGFMIPMMMMYSMMMMI
jgi:hypothetical protein